MCDLKKKVSVISIFMIFYRSGGGHAGQICNKQNKNKKTRVMHDSKLHASINA